MGFDFARLDVLVRGLTPPDTRVTAEEAAALLPAALGVGAEWIRENVDRSARGLHRWGDVLERVDPTATRWPVTHWRDVARLLNVSDDTLGRRRRASAEPDRACFFVDYDDLVEWWRSLVVAPPPPPRAAPRRRSRSSDRAVEPAEISLKELRKSLK